MSSLVSVIMPCYNAQDTLVLALASLISQTYKTWECVVVDDGSTDNSREIIGQFTDQRIRCISLPSNQGRGVARQIALNHSRGEFLTMLDADDWLYPDKLERQLALFQSKPDLALISTSLAMVAKNGELLGIRGSSGFETDLSVYAPLTRLGATPVPHAPSMIRMKVAKQYSYDINLRRSQDSDFLFQILSMHPYGLIHEPYYAYDWQATLTRQKLWGAYYYKLKMLNKYCHSYQMSWLQESVKTLFMLVYTQLAFSTGHWTRIENQRNVQPTKQLVKRHNTAHAAISRVMAELKLANNKN
ncbi:MAG: glycosyltransferase family A protein [Chloroflexota bacterium]